MLVHIFGDIGGHRDLFEASLDAVGVADGNIPDDTTIIQVGDLVDRGPDSDGVVELISSYIHLDNWIQLAGNHEAKYLGGEDFVTPDSLSEPSEKSIQLLQGWYDDGLLKIAVGVRQNGNDFLVTHAGLTMSLWKQLGKPSLDYAVDLLNGLSEERVFRAGQRLGGFKDEGAGPVWASTWNEVITHWLVEYENSGEEPPFHQIHGHETLYHWSKKKFLGHPSYAGHLIIDTARRQSRFSIGSKYVCQIDPALGRYAVTPPLPFTIHLPGLRSIVATRKAEIIQ